MFAPFLNYRAHGFNIMKEYKFYMPVKPKGKQRPRISKCGRNIYTPIETREFEATCAKYCFYFMMKYRLKCHTGPVSVDLILFKEPEAKLRKADKEAALRGERVPMCTPDGDNVMKAVLDSFNKVLYEDDKQVYRSSFEKRYGEKHGILCKIKLLDNPANPV